LANCIGHERCPQCASNGRDRHGDNLGVYDDDSRHCFSCGYHVFGSDSLGALSSGRLSDISENDGNATPGSGYNPTKTNQASEDGRRVTLPADSVGLLEGGQDNLQGLDWLSQYDLTTKEITDNLLLFSQRGIYLAKKKETVAPLLIFPIYGEDDDLLLWTGRNLSYPETGGTKWPIRGKVHKIVHGILPSNVHSTCCVCEDIVSAIKLGRIVPTYPLFGKNVSPLLLSYLSHNYENLLIYLDYDAVTEMVKLQTRLNPYFKSVRIVITPGDPKYYSTDELQQIIT